MFDCHGRMDCAQRRRVLPTDQHRERVVVQRHPLRTPMNRHRETRRQARPHHRAEHWRPRPDRTQWRRRPIDRPDQLPDLPRTIEDTHIQRRHDAPRPSLNEDSPTRPIVGRSSKATPERSGRSAVIHRRTIRPLNVGGPRPHEFARVANGGILIAMRRLTPAAFARLRAQAATGTAPLRPGSAASEASQ